MRGLLSLDLRISKEEEVVSHSIILRSEKCSVKHSDFFSILILDPSHFAEYLSRYGCFSVLLQCISFFGRPPRKRRLEQFPLFTPLALSVWHSDLLSTFMLKCVCLKVCLIVCRTARSSEEAHIFLFPLTCHLELSILKLKLKSDLMVRPNKSFILESFWAGFEICSRGICLFTLWSMVKEAALQLYSLVEFTRN